VKRFFSLLVGVALIVGLLTATAFGLARSVHALRSLQSDVAVAVAAAAATVLVSVLTLVVTKYLETRATIKQQLREKKVPIYEELISTLFRLTYSEKLGETPMSEHEVMKFFISATERLVIWGSDDVLRSFRAFRLHFVDVELQNDPRRAMKGLFLYEDMLLAIRRDLGHSNASLGRGSILGLWINDIDKHI
jgi:hypothetical protein